MNHLPLFCPSCGKGLDVKRLSCGACKTEVEGLFKLPSLAKLNLDDQEFILRFVLLGGSLKEMAAFLKLSYPTVRNRLDEIIGKLTNLQKGKYDQ